MLKQGFSQLQRTRHQDREWGDSCSSLQSKGMLKKCGVYFLLLVPLLFVVSTTTDVQYNIQVL